MRIIDIINFSGGIHEAFAPSDFTDRQWTGLKGFYLRDETRIRSQWPVQSIGTETGFKEVKTLVAYDGTKFLVAIKTNGEVWRAPAPSNSDLYGTANAINWTRITSANGTATLTVGANAHFLCETTLQVSSIASNKKIPALVINQSDDITDTVGPIMVWAESSSSINAYRILNPAAAIGIYPGYAPSAPSNVTAVQNSGNVDVTWTHEYAGSSAITSWNIYDGGGTLKTTALAAATTASYAGTVGAGTVVRGVNAYGETPFAAGGGVIVPAPGYLPRANVSVMWAGQLILGDIEYYKDPTDYDKGIALSSSNSARLRNGIWFSNIDASTTFDPLAVFTLGNPDTVVTGLTVLPQGLLVTTSTNTNDTGIYLLRGTSAGLILDEELSLNFTVELIRGGISTPVGSSNPGSIVSLWPAVGTIAFLDNKSLIWQTNTQDVVQLDLYGPLPPAQYASTDCLATWDRYLFVSRGGRLIVMREFGNEGSWTELITPNNATVSSLCEVGNSLYFIADAGTGAKVWRYNLYPVSTANAETGYIDGVAQDLVITTRPVGEPNRYEKQFWHRIGLRARGTSTAYLKEISSWNGSPLLSGTSALLTTTFSPTKAMGSRFEIVVPAHGPSVEAVAKITVNGSVEVEAVDFYVHGKKPQRL